MRIGMVEQGIHAPVMSPAPMMRFASQGDYDCAAKLLAPMRACFGGHAVRRDSNDDKVKGAG